MDNNWRKMPLSEIKIAVQAMDAEAREAACATLLTDERKTVTAFAKKMLRAEARLQEEHARLEALWHFEKIAYTEGFMHVVGTDEVGRGPLAGPVVAAAVVLAPGTEILGINDSKKLNKKKREALAEEIRQKALAYEIVEVSAAEIDRLNILHAAELAMKRAVEVLPLGDVVLVDGTNRLDVSLPCRNIIGGDGRSVSIAAASILAKVHRDALMMALDTEYPEYHFAQNKGYGTAEHYAALKKYGPCPLHRRSFRLE